MRYDGEWNQGRRQGKGVMTLSNGDVYDGEWENDRVRPAARCCCCCDARLARGWWPSF